MPTELFHSKLFVMLVLAAHLATLGHLFMRHWGIPSGPWALVGRLGLRRDPRRLDAEHIATVLLTCNFAGVPIKR